MAHIGNFIIDLLRGKMRIWRQRRNKVAFHVDFIILGRHPPLITFSIYNVPLIEPTSFYVLLSEAESSLSSLVSFERQSLQNYKYE